MARRRRRGDRPEPGERETAHRLCALTRDELDPESLIRFVVAPSGDIVPDLERRLPGRGVWITSRKSVVAKAVKANVFAKSLKRQVQVSEDLPERIEALLVRRAMEAFSLANKAGLVTTGFAQVAALVETGHAAALAHGCDAAPGGREKLDRKFLAIARETGRRAPIVTTLSTEQLSLAMGRSNVVHAALIQGGATDRYLSEAERLERYRLGSTASGAAPCTEGSEV